MKRIRGDLPFPPDVGTKFPCGDSPLADPVQFGGQRGAAGMDERVRVELSDGTVDRSLADFAGFGKCRGNEPLGERDLHVIQSRTFRENSKGENHRNSVIVDKAKHAQTVRMARPRKPRELDPWPQRLHFFELVDAKLGEGLTLLDVAKALGLETASSLQTSYRHDFSRIPKRQAMEKAAALFGVPIWEIYGPKPSQEDEEYRIGYDLALTAQGGGKPAAELTRDEIIHMGKVAIATAKAMLSNK